MNRDNWRGDNINEFDCFPVNKIKPCKIHEMKLIERK